MSAYCCTGGTTMPAALSTGATKSGGRVQHLVGRAVRPRRCRRRRARAHARASAPTTTTVASPPGRHGRQRVVDHLLLRDADLAEERARAGRADAPGHGARRVGRATTEPWGTAMRSTWRGAPARRRRPRPPTPPSVMRSTTGAASRAAPSPTRTGRRGSRVRIGPATTGDATVPPWRTAKRAGGRASSGTSPRSPSRPTANGATSSGSGAARP